MAQDEVAALLTELTSHPVTLVEVPPTGMRDGLVQAGLPSPMAEALVKFDVAASQGYHALVTPTVERLTGSQPVSLREVLRKHLAAA